MGKPLSMDLRERVVGAISGSMSRRAVAARFGVSAASAVRWAALQRDRGNAAARPQGGDTRSVRTEAKAARIWALYEASPDMTLAELRAALATEGIAVAVSTLWRFFARHGHTRKNVWPTPSARVNLDDVLVCINVSGLRASALAKMDLARHGPHKDGGVEHHIFAQASRRGVNLYAICPSPLQTS